LEGFGTGVWVSVIGLLIEAVNPYHSHVKEIRQGKEILSRYEGSRMPLGI